MKIVITGGAGYLGLYAANYLLKRFHKIKILDIADYPKEEYAGSVEYCKIDIRDYHLVSKAFCGMDLVIHAAAVLPFKRKHDIFSVTVNGTDNVLKAAKENNIKRVIFISSTSVYGMNGNMPILEEAEYFGTTDHARSKILAEQLCAAYREKGLSVAILRPVPLIGAGRMGIFQIFYDWVKENRKIPVIGRGENRFQWLDTEDLCDVISLVIDAPINLVNDNFNIGAKIFGSINDDLTGFIDEVRSKSRLVHFPSQVIKIMLKICEKIRISPVYEGVYGIIDKDLYVSINKIEKVLNWHPKSSNLEALVKAYKWYLDHDKKKLNRYNNINNRNYLKQGITSLIKKIA